MAYRRTRNSIIRNTRRTLRNPRNSSIMTYLFKHGKATYAELRDNLGLSRNIIALYTGRLVARGYIHAERIFFERTTRTTYTITAQGMSVFTDMLLACHEMGVPTTEVPKRSRNAA